MGATDKIAVIAERKVTYNGIYDMKETYSYIKNFLSDSKNYDFAEKDYEEKNDGANRKVDVKCEAELQYNDYYKIILKFNLLMDGKQVSIDTPEGMTLKRVKGSAKLTINCYIQPDWQNKRQKGPLATFLDQLHAHYLKGQQEQEKCIIHAATDVSELIARFKQQMNALKKKKKR